MTGISRFIEEFEWSHALSTAISFPGGILTTDTQLKSIQSKSRVLEKYLRTPLDLNNEEFHFGRGLLGEEILRHLLLRIFSSHKQITVIPTPKSLDKTQTVTHENMTIPSRGGDMILGTVDHASVVTPVVMIDGTVSTGSNAKKSHKFGGINSTIWTPVIVMALPRVQYGDHTALTHYIDKHSYQQIVDDTYNKDEPLLELPEQLRGQAYQSLLSGLIRSTEQTLGMIESTTAFPQQVKLLGTERLEIAQYIFQAVSDTVNTM